MRLFNPGGSGGLWRPFPTSSALRIRMNWTSPCRRMHRWGLAAMERQGAGKWYWKDGSDIPTVGPPVEVGSWNPVSYRVFFDIPGGCLGFLPSTVPLNQMIAMDWWWSCLTCGTFEAWMSKDDRVIICDYWLSSHFSRWRVWLHCFHSSQADIVEKICSTNNTEERDACT